MCGRYTLAGTEPFDLRARFPLGDHVEVRRRFNVAPGDDVVAVTTSREGAPRGELLRWGLVPHWAGDARSGYKMINARAESLAERPAYRDAFRNRRCLVLADGFYEWQARPGMPKQPWWITRADGAPFAFAGLWSTWRDGEASLRTCAIVTTRASPSLLELHDRMPVILPPHTEAAWLDPGAEPDELRELLVPLPDSASSRRPVGPAVNDARCDGPECLDPPPPEPEQAALFPTS
jgi:putative SOS response-associated peptidase YedK